MKDEITKVLNQSGFPFQIAVQNLIETKRKEEKHDWNILEHEYPWYNKENGTKGYIDLILNKPVPRIVIECKKVANNPNWIFLNDEGNKSVEIAYCLRVAQGMSYYAEWQKFFICPESLRSEYCIIEDKGRRLLESDIGILIDSIEAVAETEVRRIKVETGSQKPSSEVWYIPMIITNAKLLVTTFDKKDIDLVTGKIDSDKFDLQEVGYLRYQKSIKTILPNSDFHSPKGLVTTFIVNVNHLFPLLTVWSTNYPSGFDL